MSDKFSQDTSTHFIKPLMRTSIALITPALAAANNGNWHTAARWARFMSPHYDVQLMSAWHHETADAMIALHARRSASSIAAFAKSCPDKPIALMLTGTDVYRDIHSNTQAQHSLELARYLVVLQEKALEELPQHLRRKTIVIEQSANALKPLPLSQKSKTFRAVMVGHLREEKAPLTFMRAAARLRDEAISFEQIGEALELQYAELANDLASKHPRYHWLGGMSRARAREHIRRARLLVIPSLMEGGAQVIIEALRSCTPVLASRVSGNIGMLGEAYAGYFPAGDDQALAQLLLRAIQDKNFYTQLQSQAKARAARFTPERERAKVLHLLQQMFNQAPL
jgi:putative glycosyltransferase (TIGR04348 family)